MTFAEIATAFLIAVTSELDDHTSKKGVIITDEENHSATLFTPGHIQFAKYGRGPGKMPPVEEILKWVKTSGKVDFDSEKEALGTAWGIAISISKNGTKNYVQDAPDAMEEAINNNLQDYYDEVRKRALAINSEAISTIFNDSFPKKIVFKT